MKQFLLFFLLVITNCSFADSPDEMRIYINHKLIAVSYEGESQLLELEVSEGDTLTFEGRTDWGGLHKATLSIFDHASSEQLYQLGNSLDKQPHEGIFEHIVTRDLMGSELLFVLNFGTSTPRNWKFARVVLKKQPD